MLYQPYFTPLYSARSFFPVSYMGCTYIRAQVLFGSPNKKCAGTGICKILMLGQETGSALPPHPCSRAMAVIAYRDPDVLQFYFERDSICVNSLKKHFGLNRFRLESAFVFMPPNEPCRLTVQPGIYPVEVLGNYLVVPLIGRVAV